MAGRYTLKGKISGYADVTFGNKAGNASASINTVSAAYHNYSDDGKAFLDGSESVTSQPVTLTGYRVDWYSDLVQKGRNGYLATKKTSPDGFHLEIDVMINISSANGTLTTTVNDEVYRQTLSGS